MSSAPLMRHQRVCPPLIFRKPALRSSSSTFLMDSARRLDTGADLSARRSLSGAERQGTGESRQDFNSPVAPRSSGKFPPFAPSLRFARQGAAGCACFNVVDGYHTRPPHITVLGHMSLACSLSIAVLVFGSIARTYKTIHTKNHTH